MHLIQCSVNSVINVIICIMSRQITLFQTYFCLVLTGASDKHEFQAETRKLLDIVARSLYSDKEVSVKCSGFIYLKGCTSVYHLPVRESIHGNLNLDLFSKYYICEITVCGYFDSDLFVFNFLTCI